MILPDVLREGLDIIFCGTAAGNNSAERKAYYAGAGNLFYPTLAACGLTPRLLKPHEFPELLNCNIGLTDLVKHHFGMDKNLKAEYFDTKTFEEKIRIYQPKLVCFNGKEAAKVYFNRKKTSEVSYGLQLQTIESTRLYVAPSTSLQAIAYWDETYWHKLTELI